MERILYFMVKDKEGGKSVIITNDFLGEIGEYIYYRGKQYIITDYAEELKTDGGDN